LGFIKGAPVLPLSHVENHSDVGTVGFQTGVLPRHPHIVKDDSVWVVDKMSGQNVVKIGTKAFVFVGVHSVISDLGVKDVIKGQRHTFPVGLATRGRVLNVPPTVGIRVLFLGNFSVGWSSGDFHGNLLSLGAEAP
jgi:hypothetical protein